MRSLASAALVLVTLGASIGCSGPCESLAEQICECEPNQRERSACLEQVRNQDRPITDAEMLQCEALLDSCSCDALERQEFEACGLSRG